MPYGVFQSTMLQNSTSSGIAYATTGPNDWIANGSIMEVDVNNEYGISRRLTWRTPVGTGLVASGTNFISTRGKMTGATRGTSLASKYFSSTKWGVKPTPRRLFKVTPKRVLGMPLRSPVLGRLAGRAVPIAGWALLVYDVGNYLHTGYTEIKNGALLDPNYYRGPAIDMALRYGERE